jgi:AcrR family transcriptional regulator
MATTPRTTGTRTATERRRPQILRKAAQLFQRKGFHATSMEEIAGALSLNKATIYHHFPGGKSDLLFGIALAALEDLNNRVADVNDSTTPAERVELLVRAMIEVQVERSDETVVYHEELRRFKALLPRDQYAQLRALEHNFSERVAGAITAGVQDGSFRECDAHVVAALLIALTSSAYRTFRTGKRADVDPLVERYTTFALDGLRTR